MPSGWSESCREQRRFRNLQVCTSQKYSTADAGARRGSVQGGRAEFAQAAASRLRGCTAGYGRGGGGAACNGSARRCRCAEEKGNSSSPWTKSNLPTHPFPHTFKTKARLRACATTLRNTVALPQPNRAASPLSNLPSSSFPSPSLSVCHSAARIASATSASPAIARAFATAVSAAVTSAAAGSATRSLRSLSCQRENAIARSAHTLSSARF